MGHPPHPLPQSPENAITFCFYNSVICRLINQLFCFPSFNRRKRPRWCGTFPPRTQPPLAANAARRTRAKCRCWPWPFSRTGSWPSPSTRPRTNTTLAISRWTMWWMVRDSPIRPSHQTKPVSGFMTDFLNVIHFTDSHVSVCFVRSCWFIIKTKATKFDPIRLN